MASSGKQPYLKLYIGDIKKERTYTCLSLGAKGLWLEMLFIMHDAKPRGYLPMTNGQIARMAGSTDREVVRYLAEMEDAGTFSRNEDGVIFNRRMVRESGISAIRSKAGALAGIIRKDKPGYVYIIKRSSDSAVKLGLSSDPDKRLKAVSAKAKQDGCELIATAWVSNMAAQERLLHRQFTDQRLGGEWFGLGDDKLKSLTLQFSSDSLHFSVAKTIANAIANAIAKQPQNCDTDIDNELGSKKVKDVPAVEFDYESRFAELWNTYPAKGRTLRTDSENQFIEIMLPLPYEAQVALFCEIIEAISGKWAKSDVWQKGFVMKLSEWLRNRRWAEDPEPYAPKKSKAELVMESI